MSFTVRVLVALVAGLLVGIGVSVSVTPWVQRIPGLVEPIGLLFVNAIRMTVIPLVVASLIAGVASMRNAQAVGRLGGRAFAWFLVALAAATVFGAACAYPLLGRLRIDPAVAASLRAGAAGAGLAAADTAKQVPSLAQWVVDLVPVNVFRAAADGNILPLIVFALAFGLALTGVGESRREALLGVVRAIADGMLVLVTWVLKATPLGVFALAVPLAARMGLAAAGALVYYVALLSAISAAFVVLLYPAAVFLGRVPFGRFARAAAPGQAVGFTSRSSLAALPACIDAARTQLHLPDEIASFFLPLAASMFRVGGAIAQVVGVLFIARLYGVSLAPAQVGTVVLAVIPASLTIPGIPGGAIITVAPVLAAVGLPVEGIGILLGVDTISDMFRTMANVTGWLAVGTILGRSQASTGPQVDGRSLGAEPQSLQRQVPS